MPNNELVYQNPLKIEMQYNLFHPIESSCPMMIDWPQITFRLIDQQDYQCSRLLSLRCQRVLSIHRILRQDVLSIFMCYRCIAFGYINTSSACSNVFDKK